MVMMDHTSVNVETEGYESSKELIHIAGSKI
jgi:hypothetical protein